MGTSEDERAYVGRIYAVQCPFNKQDFPVVGTFGSRIKEVVIVPMPLWVKLCREIPELGAAKFEVGTLDG